ADAVGAVEAPAVGGGLAGRAERASSGLPHGRAVAGAALRGGLALAVEARGAGARRESVAGDGADRSAEDGLAEDALVAIGLAGARVADGVASGGLLHAAPALLVAALVVGAVVVRGAGDAGGGPALAVDARKAEGAVVALADPRLFARIEGADAVHVVVRDEEVTPRVPRVHRGAAHRAVAEPEGVAELVHEDRARVDVG